MKKLCWGREGGDHIDLIWAALHGFQEDMIVWLVRR